MLEVSKYIKDLLFVHDCVILPGFGGFVANYQAARIDNNSNTFSPPSKAIGFNRNLSKNDGLLINRLADAENLSYAESEKSVQFFIEDLRVRIQRGEKVLLEGIGAFCNDKRHNLQFEPSEELNFLADSFGLNEIDLPKISLADDVKTVTIKTNQNGSGFNRKRLWYAAAAIPFIFAITLLPKSERSPFKNSASLGLGSEENITETHVQLKPQISPPEELVCYEPKVAKNVKIDKISKDKFYLIAGSFTTKENAQILKDELISKSYPAVIIKNKNLYSVAINHFNKRSEIDAFKKKVLAVNPKSSYWVLKK